MADGEQVTEQQPVASGNRKFGLSALADVPSGSVRHVRVAKQPSPAVSHPSSELSWRLVKADGRAAPVIAFEEAVISFFLESAGLLGIPKSLAAIYGLCFASPEPLSFSDINARLNLSAGSISQGVRVLKEVGALRVVESAVLKPLSVIRDSARATNNESRLTTHGARNALRYTPDLELRKLVLHWIEHRLQTQLSSGRARLDALASSIPDDQAGGAELLTERLGALQNWHGKAAAMVPVAKGMLKLA